MLALSRLGVFLSPSGDVLIGRNTRAASAGAGVARVAGIMVPNSMLWLLLLVLVCFIIGSLVPPASGGAEPLHSSMHFELIRKRLPGGDTNWARLDHIVGIARKDHLRAEMIADRIGGGRRRRARQISFAMPISSAAYTGIGQYFVRFRLGTPSKMFLLLADTGSDLTWVKCQYRSVCRGCQDPRANSVFRPYRSSSFSSIRCSSLLCNNTLPFSLAKCPTPASPCLYDYRYSDGSTAKGIFAYEAATVTLSDHHNVKLEGIIVGCTSSSSGTSFQAADGVLGLGFSETSFATRAAARFGGKFSYCLVDHLSPKKATDYLVFGENTLHQRYSLRRYAKLVMTKPLEPFYAVQVRGISVGGQLLNITPVVWDSSRGGGVILDSGTSLTMLAEPAYGPVMAALNGSLAGYPRVEMEPFDFCFNWTKAPGGFKKAAVPRLVLHLTDDRGGVVRLQPPVKSFIIDVNDGVKCIGLLPSPWPGISTVGNILQQNYLWEFDITRRRLGFEPSSCSLK